MRFMSSLVKVRLAMVLFSTVCLSETPSIHKGTHLEHGEVSFRSFQELNWRGMAQAKLPWLNVEYPTPEQVRRLKERLPEGDPANDLTGLANTVDIRFDPGLDPGLAGGRYYLVSPLGIDDIKLVRLDGHAQYTFDDSRTNIKESTWNGFLIGSTKRAAIEDGGAHASAPNRAWMEARSASSFRADRHM